MDKVLLEQYILDSKKIAIIVEKNLFLDGKIERLFLPNNRPHINEYRKSKEIRESYQKFMKENLLSEYPFEINSIYKKILKLDVNPLVQGIINLNIDGILKKNNAKNVIDLEGNINWLYCSNCGSESSMESFVLNQDEIICKNCNDNSLKVNIPFNGQEPSQWDFKDSWMLMNSCDCLIILTADFISPITFSFIDMVTKKHNKVIFSGNLIDFRQGNTPAFFSDSHFISSIDDFLDIILELINNRYS